jgi:Putative adhesin
MAVTTPQATSRRLPLTAGRRAALAAGVPVCLALVAITGVDLVAMFGQGSFPVSYTAPSSARSLTLAEAGGQVLVTGTRTGPARLRGTARYSLARSRVTERTAAGGASISYQCAAPVGNCELDATVSAPATMPVSVRTDGGNATVTGTAGQVSLSTGGGDLSASHATGPLSLHTSGGNIHGTDIAAATVTATSGGGDIEIIFSRVPDDVRVATTGGNITLVLPPGAARYDVAAHTAGGTVSDEIAGSSSAANVITATSGGGDITVRYP